jgi:hypothetical protein
LGKERGKKSMTDYGKERKRKKNVIWDAAFIFFWAVEGSCRAKPISGFLLGS